MSLKGQGLGNEQEQEVDQQQLKEQSDDADFADKQQQNDLHSLGLEEQLDLLNLTNANHDQQAQPIESDVSVVPSFQLQESVEEMLTDPDPDSAHAQLRTTETNDEEVDNDDDGIKSIFKAKNPRLSCSSVTDIISSEIVERLQQQRSKNGAAATAEDGGGVVTEANLKSTEKFVDITAQGGPAAAAAAGGAGPPTPGAATAASGQGQEQPAQHPQELPSKSKENLKRKYHFCDEQKDYAVLLFQTGHTCKEVLNEMNPKCHTSSLYRWRSAYNWKQPVREQMEKMLNAIRYKNQN